MHITVIAIGSRGDVQPYIALSKGLMDAGHTVLFVTHAAFAALIDGYGIAFLPLDNESKEIFQTESGKELLEKGTNPFLFAQRFARGMDPFVPLYMQRCDEACQGADAIVVSPLSLPIGYSIAEKLKKSLVMTLLQPTLLSTGAIMEPTSPWLPQWPPLLGRMLNYQSHFLAQQYTRLLFAPAVNAARQSIYGLPPLPKSFYSSLPRFVDLTLCAYSPLLIPRPADWSETIYVTGFWTLKHQDSWQPDAALVDFIHAGPAPVYVGFGSMSPYHPAETVDLVREALTLAGQRAILLVDKSSFCEQKLSDTLYITDGVPHDWLFPQMQVVVHHGGAGTTASSLHAGIPMIIVPHITDQWFWGKHVAELGVGPRPVNRQHLSAKKLAGLLIAAVQSQEMQGRASEVGRQIRNENGVEQAVKAISAHMTDKER